MVDPGVVNPNSKQGNHTMSDAFICDAIRTPVGRYGGGLSAVRTDDLGAVPIKALMDRNNSVDWEKIDDVYFGSANQAGEDNRNVARMSALLAGLPLEVGGATVNRLCGSGMEATAQGARAIRVGEADMVITGGVESMSRAPFVMAKADLPFSRKAEIFDTTIGWRFVNPKMEKLFGVDAMGETAENLAEEHQITRADQDKFALWSQQKAEAAQKRGYLASEIIAVNVPQRRGVDAVIDSDEHPRHGTTLEDLSNLRPAFKKDGSVTAGNSSGVNDGAAALLLANEEAAKKHGLTPRARIIGAATAGVPPRIMGIGPAPATRKVLEKSGLTLDNLDVMEFNEAFAAQALACTRDLGIADDDERINPNGGAIALGHPLGMSGARLMTTALNQLERAGGKYALCTMCIGVGQGISTLIERV
ncbi:MAG: Beta-ketoadipyl-CoA thiolase [Alphaproteobacteria bacterium MarineAlpha11_Bin1]|nr:MAG: Beta-ketoadipyl-CoA thiolase [Alphaproteobacteria bacterium MarineAlpha11_Bin1]